MTCALLAYATSAAGCGAAIAADFHRHRDGFPIAEVVFRVVVAAVLWPGGVTSISRPDGVVVQEEP